MKLIKVKFIKQGGVVGMAHWLGDVVSMPEIMAIELQERGIVEKFNPANEPATDLPESLPARDLILEAGITTIEEVLMEIEAGTLTTIKGIGKVTATQIAKQLQ